MKNDALESRLEKVARLDLDLDKQGGPSENGELFEQIMEMQYDILESFGLPFSYNYTQLLSFNSIPTKQEIKERITKLHSTAEKYLSDNAKSDRQILQDAQENQSDVMLILPELKIRTHLYMIFVFNEILLERKDSIENVLTELRLFNQAQILNSLNLLIQSGAGQDHKLFEYLEKAGAKYLKNFLNSEYY